MKVLHAIPGKLVEMMDEEGRWVVEWLKKLGYVTFANDVWTPDKVRCVGDVQRVNNKELFGTVGETETRWHFEPDHLVKIIPLLREELARLRELTERGTTVDGTWL